jgi:hypothetical protein
MKKTPDTPDPNPNPQKRVRGDALKRLRKAAKRNVRDNSARIAKALLDHTLKGDLPSAKMLVSLIDKPKPKGKKIPKSRRGYSLALDLASDPECPPEEWDKDFADDPDKPPSS